ncbi:hypothetical protein [Thiorhodococcus minor]|uniref:FkbM family methyltransferase n=1 Tax=Thiorhodococcus minor TaxID=57489 RepID=A0A6M0K6D6_9GAMM|nr:hypothetical protein [Thiorhodococcus minor]NEV65322.1 hypothetical protein [Thiorhodococcus minor]
MKATKLEALRRYYGKESRPAAVFDVGVNSHSSFAVLRMSVSAVTWTRGVSVGFAPKRANPSKTLPTQAQHPSKRAKLQNSQTAELIAFFPTVKHYLFEPDDTHFTAIKKNYRSISYSLHPVAPTDHASSGFLVKTSLHRDGVATHSSIKNEPQVVDGKRVVSCTEFTSTRFDVLGIAVPKNSLLKVDTDGSDLQVIRLSRLLWGCDIFKINGLPAAFR